MRQRCANVRSELSGDQEGSREPSGLRPKSKNQAIHGVSKWPSRVGEFAAPSGAVLGSATGPSLGPSSGLGSDPGKARVPSFRSPMGVLPLGLSFDQSGGQLLAFWNEAPYAHPLCGRSSAHQPPTRNGFPFVQNGLPFETGGLPAVALVSPERLALEIWESRRIDPSSAAHPSGIAPEKHLARSRITGCPWQILTHSSATDRIDSASRLRPIMSPRNDGGAHDRDTRQGKNHKRKGPIGPFLYFNCWGRSSPELRQAFPEWE